MEIERWERVKEVLYGALERPAEKRLAFLDDRCRDDSSLRAEVESLLGGEEEAGNFIEQPVIRRHPDETEAGLPEERRIGPYEVVERLGRGGMGVVYLARRADQEFEQKVAVKVIKRGMDTEEIVSRFRHERQILARLDHPHIARLFDGGTTSSGLPYFVMEYVQGEPIREYCESHGLGTTERLRLFLEVCDAVHFAHQNLVVHRDLKPANILVTEDGSVKLLDFGVARLLGTDSTSDLTRQVMGGRLLTPEYASPEQLRGDPVTTVSDVFSLGVLFYELLTGQRPFDDESTGDTLIDVTRKQPPERPSAVLSRKARKIAAGDEGATRRLRWRLAGDLDHIVLKALRREPDERYASAREFAEDIERHLTGYPVLARKGATLYVLCRFSRRHARSLAAAAAVLTLVVVLALSVRQHQRSKDEALAERQRAEREYVRAEGIQELLRSIFIGADPSSIRKEPPTLYEILDQGAESVMNSQSVEPGAKALLLNTLGHVCGQLGRWAQAEELLQESLRLRRQVFGEDHPLVGQSLNNLAFVLRSQGSIANAEAAYRRAIEIGRKSDPDPTRLPTYLNNLAGLLRRYGNDFEEVIDLFNESLELKRNHYGEGVVNEHIAVTLKNLGNTWLALGEYEQAEPLFQEALEIQQSLELPTAVATTLHSLGVLYRDRNELERAEEYLQRSLQLRREIFEQSDLSRIATVLRSLAVCLHLQGQWDEAEDFHRQALEIQRELWEDGHRETAITLRELAHLLNAKGNPAEGEGYAREALEMLDRKVRPGHWQIADIKSVLGAAALALGRYGEARQLLEEGHADLVAVKGPKIRWSREARARLAALEEARRSAE